jgi:cytochrome b pre-mRNA-processing protein 3
MIFGLFGAGRRNSVIIDRLHSAVVEAARRPAFYAELGVPDTFEGRFDLVTLHATLVVRRLRALPDPGSALAQDLVDALFLGFDRALREMGVGDLAVPKRMKTIASAFLGRARAYEAGLVAVGDELETAIMRNVYGRSDPLSPEAGRLASYVRAAARALEEADFKAFEAGLPPFPDPLAIYEAAP